MIPLNIDQTRGNLGNRMFQYMYCRVLQDHIPDLEIGGVDMPDLGMWREPLDLGGRLLHLTAGHEHSMAKIARLVGDGVYDSILFGAYVQRLEFYRDRQRMAALFPLDGNLREDFLGPDHITLNVRGAEVLGGTHHDYNPVPVSFYEQVVEETGLRPVLVGQVGDDDYSAEIRRRLPGARLVESRSPRQDFELVFNSRNIVVGVSSFSWLAAWLSPVATTIHFPVSGLFNPAQRPDVDLLPVGDPRYRFYRFPVFQWEATPDQCVDLLAPGRRFPELVGDDLRQLLVY